MSWSRHRNHCDKKHYTDKATIDTKDYSIAYDHHRQNRKVIGLLQPENTQIVSTASSGYSGTIDKYICRSLLIQKNKSNFHIFDKLIDIQQNIWDDFLSTGHQVLPKDFSLMRI